MNLRVAVVDGVGGGRWLTRELAGRGAECVHVKSRPVLEPHLESSFRPDDYALDLGYDHDVGRLATRLGNLGVAWIAAGHACGVPTAEVLARLTGLPGDAPELAEARHDRQAMARRLYEAGLDAPLGTHVTSAEQAVAWFTEAELGAVGAVVRPADGTGPDRARFCSTAEQVHAAVTAVLGAAAPPGSATVFGGGQHSAVVQETLAGTEYYVDTVSVDGVHLIADTWRCTREPGPGGQPVADYEEPADPSAPEVAAIHSYLLRALDALGVRHGAAHSLVVLTARGPVLIDPGAGLGEDVLPWIAEKFIGYSHPGLLAAGILQPRDTLRQAGRLPEPWPEPIRRVALVNRRPGPVRPAAQWAGALEALPTAIAVTAVAGAGMELPLTRGPGTSPGFVYLSAADPARIERDHQTIREWEQQGPYTG